MTPLPLPHSPLFFLALGLLCLTANAAGTRPNVIVFLADDLGYADVGCYGAKDIRTPVIDRLAREGVRFTNFYSGGTSCSPTRTSLLTGQHPQRHPGMECAIGEGNVGRYDDAIRLRATNDLGLRGSDASLARVLKSVGYATALSGKWHLGYEDKFQPAAHGFDHAFYALGGGMDYFRHTEQPPENLPVLRLNGREVHREGYFTTLIADDAISFLATHHHRPFFLYVPFTAPHAPYQGPQDKPSDPATKDSPIWKQDSGPPAIYAAMIESMDSAIARILDEIDRQGLASRTLVIFTSDNGGTASARPAGFRGLKGSTFEGGIRVPCIVRWPGVLPANLTVDAPAITMDLPASIIAAAGARLPTGHQLDGMDVLGHLAAGRPLPTRPLFWRGRRGDSTWLGVREGSLKYVRQTVRGETTVEGIFDLTQDPAESRDLRATRPDATQRLRNLASDWETAMRPSLPTPRL